MSGRFPTIRHVWVALTLTGTDNLGRTVNVSTTTAAGLDVQS